MKIRKWYDYFKSCGPFTSYTFEGTFALDDPRWLGVQINSLCTTYFNLLLWGVASSDLPSQNPSGKSSAQYIIDVVASHKKSETKLVSLEMVKLQLDLAIVSPTRFFCFRGHEILEGWVKERVPINSSRHWDSPENKRYNLPYPDTPLQLITFITSSLRYYKTLHG